MIRRPSASFWLAVILSLDPLWGLVSLLPVVGQALASAGIPILVYALPLVLVWLGFFVLLLRGLLRRSRAALIMFMLYIPLGTMFFVARVNQVIFHKTQFPGTEGYGVESSLAITVGIAVLLVLTGGFEFVAYKDLRAKVA